MTSVRSSSLHKSRDVCADAAGFWASSSGTSSAKTEPVRVAVAILCVLAAACYTDVRTGPSPSVNRELVLAPGGVASIAEAALTVRFEGVTGDSRCPADAVCIQGGDAIVTIVVRSDAFTKSYELHTGDMRPVTHEDLVIELVQLAPYPFSSHPIDPGDYRATLRIRR